MKSCASVMTALRAVPVAVLVAVSVPAAAQSTQFLKIESVDGGSTVTRHEREIELASFDWGVSVSIDATSGRAASRPVLSDLSWTQVVDASTPLLFGGLTSLRHYADATLKLDHLGTTYFQMLFRDVTLTSMNLGGVSGDPVNVAGSFAYGAIEMTYWNIDPRTGRAGSPVSASYDLSTGRGDLAALATIYTAARVGAQVSAVPEPDSFAMMLAGVGLLSWVVRRRRR